MSNQLSESQNTRLQRIKKGLNTQYAEDPIEVGPHGQSGPFSTPKNPRHAPNSSQNTQQNTKSRECSPAKEQGDEINFKMEELKSQLDSFIKDRNTQKSLLTQTEKSLNALSKYQPKSSTKHADLLVKKNLTIEEINRLTDIINGFEPELLRLQETLDLLNLKLNGELNSQIPKKKDPPIDSKPLPPILTNKPQQASNFPYSNISESNSAKKKPKFVSEHETIQNLLDHRKKMLNSNHFDLDEGVDKVFDMVFKVFDKEQESKKIYNVLWAVFKEQTFRDEDKLKFNADYDKYGGKDARPTAEEAFMARVIEKKKLLRPKRRELIREILSGEILMREDTKEGFLAVAVPGKDQIFLKTSSKENLTFFEYENLIHNGYSCVFGGNSGKFHGIAKMNSQGDILVVGINKTGTKDHFTLVKVWPSPTNANYLRDTIDAQNQNEVLQNFGLDGLSEHLESYEENEYPSLPPQPPKIAPDEFYLTENPPISEDHNTSNPDPTSQLNFNSEISTESYGNYYNRPFVCGDITKHTQPKKKPGPNIYIGDCIVMNDPYITSPSSNDLKKNNYRGPRLSKEDLLKNSGNGYYYGPGRGLPNRISNKVKGERDGDGVEETYGLKEMKKNIER